MYVVFLLSDLSANIYTKIKQKWWQDNQTLRGGKHYSDKIAGSHELNVLSYNCRIKM